VGTACGEFNGVSPISVKRFGVLALRRNFGQAGRSPGRQEATMLKVLTHSWPLLMGIMLLMVGNGIQGTLLGIRGNLEGFTTYQLSYVMAAYFLGFLFGSWAAPKMIRRSAMSGSSPRSARSSRRSW
jgi:hypothetical protein